MTKRSFRALAALPALLALPVAVALVAPGAAAVAPGARYAALGDSYAAGVGATAPLPGAADVACRRTANGYPQVLARDLAGGGTALDLAHVACSGKTTDQVAAEQLGAVAAGTGLVTLTVGANDTGIVEALRACVLTPDSCAQVSADSATAYEPADLRALLLEIDRRAGTPGPAGPAEVLVTGYPQPFDVAGVAAGRCTGLAPTPEVAGLLNGLALALDTAVAAVAAEAGVAAANTRIRYVDVDPLFEGHRLCSADPWLNPVDPADLVPALHPTDAGHAAYARALRAALPPAPVVTPSPTTTATATTAPVSASTAPSRTATTRPAIPTAVDAGDGSAGWSGPLGAPAALAAAAAAALALVAGLRVRGSGRRH